MSRHACSTLLFAAVLAGCGGHAAGTDAGGGIDATGEVVDASGGDAGTDASTTVIDAGTDAAPDAPACTAVPWHSEYVSSGGNWGGVTSIAIDPAGVPHIVLHRAVYGAYGARELLYATPGGSGWLLEPIITGTGNDRDDTSDLVFDSTGAPHVVFPGLGDGSEPHRSTHATRTAAGWVFHLLGPGNTYAALAIDAADTVHVASGETQLHYASRTAAGTWAQEDRGDARCMSIAAAANGTVHVAYVTTPASATSSELRYATRTPAGAWTDEYVEALGALVGYGCETNVDLDPSGAVHVVYTAASGLRHAVRAAAGSWTMETFGAGVHVSMDVDDAGGVHVSFGGGYAYLPPVGTWMTTSIASGWGPMPKADTSIAVDHAGVVHIASYDETASTGPGYSIYYTTGRVCPP